MIFYTTVGSPLGELTLTGAETPDRGFALTALSVPGQRFRSGGLFPQDGLRREPALFAEAETQLREYFAGERREFDMEFAAAGTDFRQRVWAALDALPYGATVTYTQLSAAAGSPGAVRAVGGAIGANPLLVLRPCHRVIGANGTLTGYAGGIERKQALLTLEGVL